MRNNRTRKQMGIVRVVRVYVGRSNHAKLDVLDVARRQLDHLGPLGMRAKRGQTNRRYLRKGYLRFEFRTVAMRRRFADRVAEFCDPSVFLEFYKRRF